MKRFLIRTNLSPVSKICLAGLFIALATIFQKVVGINYYIIPIPFLRISFGGPAIVIFSSIFLGPFYGAAVGLFSDLLGYLLFDPKTITFLPQITILYFVLGLCSCFIFSLFKKFKNKKICLFTEISILTILLISLSIYLFTHNEISLISGAYSIELWQKIVLVSSLLIFSILMIAFIIIISKIFEKKHINSPMNCYQISFSLLIIELLIMVGLGGLLKGWAFGFSLYPLILICQIIVLFFNVPINTILITIFMNILKKKFDIVNIES